MPTPDEELDDMSLHFQEMLSFENASKPGWVFLLLDEHGMQGHIFAKIIKQLKSLKNTSNDQIYHRLEHYVSAYSHSSLIDDINALEKQLDIKSSVIQIKPPVETWSIALSNTKRGTIAIIHEFDTLGNDISANSSPQKKWNGNTLRTSFKDEYCAASLEINLPKLIGAAKELDILVIAIVKASSFTARYLSHHLSTQDDLAIFGAANAINRYDHFCAKIIQMVHKHGMSLKKALSKIEKVTNEGEIRLQMQAAIYQAFGLYGASWDCYSKMWNSLDVSTPSQCLSLAHIAFAAFDLEKANFLLEKALDLGLNTYQECQSAWALSNEIKDDRIIEMVFQKMVADFATREITLKELTRRAAQNSDFASASRFSRANNNHFAAEVFLALATPPLDVEALLAKYRSDDQQGFILYWASHVSERDENIEDTIHWATMMPQGHHLYESALICRIRAFFKGLRKTDALDSESVGLQALIGDILKYPQFNKARGTFISMAEDSDIHGAILAMTILVLHSHVGAFLENAKMLPRYSRCPRHGSEAPQEEIITYIREAMAHNGTKAAIGSTQATPSISRMASYDMIRALCHFNDASPGDLSSSHESAIRIMLIELLCRELKEPSLDIMSAYYYIRRFGRMGKFQIGRDLAEEVFQGMVPTQNEHLLWRQGLSWMCIAEAQYGGGNLTSAMLSCLMTLSAWTTQSIQSEEICDFLNLVFRILRGLRLHEIAYAYYVFERDLRMSTGSTEELWKLDQMEMDLEAGLLSSRNDYLKYLIRLMRTWRSLPVGVDELPLLSRIASIVRHIRHNWHDLKIHFITTDIADALTKHSASESDIFFALLHGHVSESGLLALIERYGDALRIEDLQYQVRYIKLVAQDGIICATSQHYADLFIRCMSLLAQPSLSLEATSTNKQDTSLQEELIRKARETIKQSDEDSALDLKRIVGKAGRPQLMALSVLFDIDHGRVCELISPDEHIIFLTQSPDRILRCCLFAHGGTTFIWQNSYEHWDGNVSCNIRDFFQEDSNGLIASFDFTALSKAFDKARGLFLPVIPTKLTVIPDATLFSFPFNVCPVYSTFFSCDQHGFPGKAPYHCGEAIALSVAPSAYWLSKTRTSPLNNSNKRIAWLGDIASVDSALVDLRRRLRPVLEANGFSILENAHLDDFKSCQICVVGSHGSPIDPLRPSDLTDGRASYSADFLASLAASSSCVILATCYGANGHALERSSEVRGVVSKMLEFEVRSIIACHWPLSTEVFSRWFIEFLNGINSGLDIATANTASNLKLKEQGCSMDEWAAMSVFGDGRTLLPQCAPNE